MPKLRLSYVVLAFVASCAAPEIPDGKLACANAGECPSDFVCRSNRCFREAIDDDADAGDGGPSVDGGPDGGPNLDGGPDGSPDGGPSGTCLATAQFGTPMPVSGLDGPDNDFSRSMTADERHVYFHSTTRPGMGGADIFVASRGTRSEAFGLPTALDALNTNGNDTDPAISRDGTTLVFGRVGSATDLWMATAPGPTGPFTGLTALESSAYNDTGAFITGTSDVYFSAGEFKTIYFRAYNGSTWNATAVVLGLESVTNAFTPILDESQKTIFFASGTTDTEIRFATRSSTSGSFGATQSVQNVSATGYDFPVFLSDDGCRLYITSNRAGNHDLYVATRSP